MFGLDLGLGLTVLTSLVDNDPEFCHGIFNKQIAAVESVMYRVLYRVPHRNTSVFKRITCCT